MVFGFVKTESWFAASSRSDRRVSISGLQTPYRWSYVALVNDDVGLEVVDLFCLTVTWYYEWLQELVNRVCMTASPVSTHCDYHVGLLDTGSLELKFTVVHSVGPPKLNYPHRICFHLATSLVKDQHEAATTPKSDMVRQCNARHGRC